jgi:hypothetical protein
MDIKVVRELLENPDVRQIIEEQIAKAVEQKDSELEKERTSIVEQKKSADKQLFIMKKTILAKSSLYEKKLKEFYETKFEEAKKKLAKETYEFINESVKNLTSAIQEEAILTSKSNQLTETFAKAVKLMAPYININELVESKANEKIVADLEVRVNGLMKANKELAEKAVKADIQELVVSECTDYPVTKQAIIFKTVQKLNPKTLVEAKEAITAAKDALKKKEDELLEEAKKKEIKTEEVKPIVEEKTTKTEDDARIRLKLIAEGARSEARKNVEENDKNSKVSALSYDIFLDI